MADGCEHRQWINRGAGLICVECEVMWPGHQLPEPIHQREGWGELANQPSWSSRIAKMIATPVDYG